MASSSYTLVQNPTSAGQRFVELNFDPDAPRTLVGADASQTRPRKRKLQRVFAGNFDRPNPNARAASRARIVLPPQRLPHQAQIETAIVVR
jgi:hypothetical protein